MGCGTPPARSSAATASPMVCCCDALTPSLPRPSAVCSALSIDSSAAAVLVACACIMRVRSPSLRVTTETRHLNWLIVWPRWRRASQVKSLQGVGKVHQRMHRGITRFLTKHFVVLHVQGRVCWHALGMSVQ